MNVLFKYWESHLLIFPEKKKDSIHINTVYYKSTIIHIFVKYKQAQAQVLSLLFIPRQVIPLPGARTPHPEQTR